MYYSTFKIRLNVATELMMLKSCLVWNVFVILLIHNISASLLLFVNYTIPLDQGFSTLRILYSSVKKIHIFGVLNAASMALWRKILGRQIDNFWKSETLFFKASNGWLVDYKNRNSLFSKSFIGRLTRCLSNTLLNQLLI